MLLGARSSPPRPGRQHCAACRTSSPPTLFMAPLLVRGEAAGPVLVVDTLIGLAALLACRGPVPVPLRRRRHQPADPRAVLALHDLLGLPADQRPAAARRDGLRRPLAEPLAVGGARGHQRGPARHLHPQRLGGARAVVDRADRYPRAAAVAGLRAGGGAVRGAGAGADPPPGGLDRRPARRLELRPPLHAEGRASTMVRERPLFGLGPDLVKRRYAIYRAALGAAPRGAPSAQHQSCRSRPSGGSLPSPPTWP